MKEASGRCLITQLFFVVIWEKIRKAYLQMKREAYDNSPESLQQDMVSSVSGDTRDFIDEGQEAAWEPTTLCLQKQPQSPAVQDMTAAFHFAVKGRDI